MGDLADDTGVRELGGSATAAESGTRRRFEAGLSRDWEIWGPMGGYVAACALRAVGASVDGLKPAAFSCHYLSVAEFGTVDITVTSRKEGRTAASHRVEMTQGERRILDGMVWSVGQVEGLEHDETEAPDVPSHEDLPEIRDLLPEDAQPPFPFWANFEAKPVDFEVDWPPEGPRAAKWQEWLRFVPTSTFEDPWVDAARTVILVDLPSWPSAHRPHAWTQPPYIAPTLDLNVAFHRPTFGHEWLLCDGAAPLSTDGLFGWTGRVWSVGGRLHASGGGQCLYRRLPAQRG